MDDSDWRTSIMPVLRWALQRHRCVDYNLCKLVQVDRAICIAGTHQTDDDSLVAVSGYGNTVDIVDSPLARAASLAMP